MNVNKSILRIDDKSGSLPDLCLSVEKNKAWQS